MRRGKCDRVAIIAEPEDAPSICWSPIDVASLAGGGLKLKIVNNLRPPVHLRIVAMTDATDIRIGYAADEIIFNWSGNQDELRIGGGPAGGHHKAGGAGRIPINKWLTFDLIVVPKLMTIKVDQQVRHTVEGDFSNVDQPLNLFTDGNSVVKIKSVYLLPG